MANAAKCAINTGITHPMFNFHPCEDAPPNCLGVRMSLFCETATPPQREAQVCMTARVLLQPGYPPLACRVDLLSPASRLTVPHAPAWCTPLPTGHQQLEHHCCGAGSS